VEQLLRQAQPIVLSLFRMVVGLLFACHGLKSLFGLFQGVDGHGSTLSPVNWPGGYAADIQFLAGASVMLGVLTRPAALIASGSMAYAYFDVHLPTGFWPIADHGEPAVMFCWAFFLLAFTGPGSLRILQRRTPTWQADDNRRTDGRPHRERARERDAANADGRLRSRAGTQSWEHSLNRESS
jgi:putative oxidoreductase